jgi:hypothetical protein
MRLGSGRSVDLGHRRDKEWLFSLAKNIQKQSVPPPPSSVAPNEPSKESAPSPEPPESRRVRFIKFLEHPWVLAIFGLLGGILGLIFYPFLVMSVACVAGAFHRQKVVEGLSWKIQVPSYVGVCLFTGLCVLGAVQTIRESTHIATGAEIAQQILPFLKLAPQQQPAPQPQGPTVDKSEIREINSIFASRDEGQLREYFGFLEMLRMNIAMDKARRENYLATGSVNLDLTPYMVGRETLWNMRYQPDGIVLTPGGAKVTLDINSVQLLVLPEDYSTRSKRLREFEDSALLPASVRLAIKNFAEDLDQDTGMMQSMLNNAMRIDPNFFLMHDDESQVQYYKVIDQQYWRDFIVLQPDADRVLDSIRNIEHSD